MTEPRRTTTQLALYLRLTRWTLVVAVVAFGTVASVGAIAKLIIESWTSLEYEIHWTTSVPVLVVLVTLVVNGEWNKRRVQYS